MAEFPKSFKTLEIEQRCEYGFTAHYVTDLCNNWKSIKDYAWIVHDMDTNDDGSEIPAHIHLMLRFKDSVPTTAILAKLDGVCKMQHLQKMQSWRSAIAYLTHSNALTKYRYPDDAVRSNFEWQIDRDAAIASKGRLDDIIAGIDSGRIREYNYTEYITMNDAIKYKRQIDIAFKYRKDRLEGADRQMECIYITGESGAGKTTFAKEMCIENGFSYFVSSGSNDVLDGYKGQDVIILDDLRPSSMGLSDLLKMLDNNTASSVKSRYSNKVLECKQIIITTTRDIDDFFRNVFEHEREAIVQLKRRCRTLIYMTYDERKYYVWNQVHHEYDLIGVGPNPITLRERELTQKDKMDILKSTLGNTFKGLGIIMSKADEYFTDEEQLGFTDMMLTNEPTPFD